MKTALQMYCLRDYFETGLPSVLDRVREMGYDGVEWVGVPGYTPAELAQLSREAGLEVFSYFIDYDQIAHWTDEDIAMRKAEGFDYLVLCWLPEERLAGGVLYGETVEGLCSFGRRANATGCRLLYHNHDFDLAETCDPALRRLDVLCRDVGPEYLGLEPDTCWLYSGGVDPVEYLCRYADRSPLVHLKDCVEAGGRYGYRPVGDGCLNFVKILQACPDAKWVSVEQDEPSGGLDAFACAERSIRNLRKLLG